MKSTKSVCIWGMLLALTPNCHAVNVNDVDNEMVDDISPERLAQFTKEFGCNGEPICNNLARTMLLEKTHPNAINFLKTETRNQGDDNSDVPWTFYEEKKPVEYHLFKELVYLESCEVRDKVEEPWPKGYTWE